MKGVKIMVIISFVALSFCGIPKIVNQKLITSNTENPFFSNLTAIETQNFIRPQEDKITLSLYSYEGGSEVCDLCRWKYSRYYR